MFDPADITNFDPRLLSHHEQWPEPTTLERLRSYRILCCKTGTDVPTQFTLPSTIAERHRLWLQDIGGAYKVKYESTTSPAPQVVEIPRVISQSSIPNPENTLEDAMAQHAQMCTIMDYYILDAGSVEERASLGLSDQGLRADERLLSTKVHHKGVHSGYLYLSPGPSVTGLHGEDAELGSISRFLGGNVKIWVLVPGSQRVQLETCVACMLNIPAAKCSQFVRQQNLMIPPSVLKSWNILFFVEMQYRDQDGEVIVETFPGCYHYIYNSGANVAEAVNCCEPNWFPPPLYRFCTRSCGGPSLVRITAQSMEPSSETTQSFGRLKMLGDRPQKSAVANYENPLQSDLKTVCDDTEVSYTTTVGDDDEVCREIQEHIAALKKMGRRGRLDLQGIERFIPNLGRKDSWLNDNMVYAGMEALVRNRPEVKVLWPVPPKCFHRPKPLLPLGPAKEVKLFVLAVQSKEHWFLVTFEVEQKLTTVYEQGRSVIGEKLARIACERWQSAWTLKEEQVCSVLPKFTALTHRRTSITPLVKTAASMF